eukprot:TRINITY_DN6036_c2_g2_i2.p1 TRINITY_DN6036_c2_g2~~TRINITY_DN6036_c2_g2_i2.p1  ORF type:complete len:255 (+),score=37.76 TRINITY_DN6036_c2_g2_i2:102-866(+)
MAVPHDTCRGFAELCATFLLEVLGGAGAVWGCAECAGVRGGPNNDEWRCVCACVGALCLWRWAALRIFDVSSRRSDVLCTFVLEVLGGCGAMWGILEIVGLRVNYPSDCHIPRTTGRHGSFQGVDGAWAPGYGSCRNTYFESRLVCMVFLIYFGLRWGNLLPSGRKFKTADRMLGTFILEVVGGAGAVWGVSEVCGPAGKSLRLGWGDKYFGQPSFDVWRIVCGGVLLLCALRWVLSEVKRWCSTEPAESILVV